MEGKIKRQDGRGTYGSEGEKECMKKERKMMSVKNKQTKREKKKERDREEGGRIEGVMDR